MPFKFFLIPVQASQSAEDEMNAFIRSHTVLDVERRFVEQGSSSFWSCSVEFLDAPSRSVGRQAGKRAEVDYREVLGEADFAIYAQLRELRKELAQADRVPAYQVFNNQQLADIVRKRMRTKEELQSLPGVGDARVEKYGDAFLKKLTELGDRPDEKDGKPV